MLYAIEVPHSAHDWLYVTIQHPSGEYGARAVVTFDTPEKAQEEGDKVWKNFRVVEVLPDINDT